MQNFFNTICFIILSLFFSCGNTPKTKTEVVKKIDLNKTHKKSIEALQFCKKNNLNTNFCILIDMSIHSGLKRFIVYDFKKDTIEYSFLVGHGCCDHQWSDDESKDSPKFSNKDGSHCSALGKYKLGERAYSDWGVNIKYVMHGLEQSNSNAQKRYIVFHSWDKVTDQEIYPNGTPEGWGCPTISNNSFKIIDPLIKESPKPVLMWIYN